MEQDAAGAEHASDLHQRAAALGLKIVTTEPPDKSLPPECRGPFTLVDADGYHACGYCGVCREVIEDQLAQGEREAHHDAL